MKNLRRQPAGKSLLARYLGTLPGKNLTRMA